MLGVNWEDVVKVLDSIKFHLIGIGIAIVLGVVIAVAVMKIANKPLRRLIRSEALIAMVLAILIIVNTMCTGPMSTLLTSKFGKPVTKIDESTTAEATALVNQICEEGIVLLKDENNILPLQNKKVNVFGWSAVNPCYGGTGSGALNTAYPTVTFLDGLKNAGIEYNEDLIKFYDDYTAKFQAMEAYKAKDNNPAVMLPNVGMWAQNWTLPQPYASEYDSGLIEGAKSFSDTALLFISRVGGEGADLPTDMAAVADGTYKIDTPMSYDDTVNNGTDWDAGDHFLQLSNPEEELLDLVCSNFQNVVVVYNSANPFELGFIDEHPEIKGALWCPGTGQAGFTALGSILAGDVNPSGRLIDTYVYDMTAAPTWNNMGYHPYDNMDEHGGTSFGAPTTPSFVNYVEGIYVGYKFYETAAKEGLIDFDGTVQFPFGYGLSYTTFSQQLDSAALDGDNIKLSVTVTNTGSAAGKEVVQVYFEPPYNNGGIEKASANLVEFAKTGIIEPGQSETVEISFPVEQMASYDYSGRGCYVLEAGEYVISINSNSHTVLDSETFTLSEVVYDQNNKRSSDAAAAVNQFDYASGGVTYLSRRDGFANYAQATAAPASSTMSDELKAQFCDNSTYLNAEATAADEDPNAQMPTTGAKNGVKLVDLRGAAYDDAKWDELLDQLTVDEMKELIALGGYQTLAIPSIDKYRTNDCDGPASINNNFTGQGSVGFPAAVMIAATWNDEMALKFGQSIGKMADQMDTAGWYAPAMNIHRTPFAGRNFEYYSEDSVISGSMAANATIGAEEYGVYAYIKHFALNDQETNRCGKLCTWTNEQAMREIYLKPFEIAVKEGGAKAVMSSFNFIGARWAGGTKELCRTVLRDEWGFQGMVLTDYFGVYGYMSADQGVRNGTDFCLVNYPTETNEMQFTGTAGAQQAMREAAKNILYVVVNSRQYSEEGIELSTQIDRWKIVLTVVNVVVGVLLVLWEVLTIKKFLGNKKNKKARN